MGYSLGIDLGTTYSAAAISRNGGAVEVCTLGTTSQSIPSVVVLREGGEILTGEAAERRAAGDPTRTAREFKRRLGDPVPIIIGTTPYGAEALMALLLRDIVAQVSEREGTPPDVVVLTHPANYSDYKKGLLEEAARLAGLDLARVRFVSEPQAAAVAYAGQRRVEVGDVVAVYDFGGGTFDAAVVRAEDDGAFTLLGSPEGMDRLGGIDVDQAVLAHVDASLDGMVTTADTSDPATRSAVVRLREEVRRAKEALSNDTDATIAVALPGVQTEVRLTRDELEGMIRPRLAETVEALRRAVASAGVSMDGVSRVLLVGGSSRIPLVGLLVREMTGRPVAVDAHPKLAIATGAAIVGASEAADTAVVTAAEAAIEPGPAGPSAGQGFEKASPHARRGLGRMATAAGLGFSATAAGAALLGAGRAASATGATGVSGAAGAAGLVGVPGVGPVGVSTASGPAGVPMASGPVGAPVASGPAGTARGPGPAPGPAAATGGPPPAPAVASVPKPRRLPVPPAAAAAAVGVIAAVAAVVAVTSQGDDPTPTASEVATTIAAPSAPTQATEPNATSTAPTTAPEGGRGVTGDTVVLAGRAGDNSGTGVPGPATAASLGAPSVVVSGPDGSAFVIDRGAGRLLRVRDAQVTVAHVAKVLGPIGGLAVSAEGKVMLLAQNGLLEITSDGESRVLATLAELGEGISPGATTPMTFDGAGNLYIANSARYRVLRRSKDGAMSLVAGNGQLAGGPALGDGGAATAAPLSTMNTIVVDAKGNLLLGEAGGALRQVSTDGTMSTIAGGGATKLLTGTGTFAPDGTKAADLDLAAVSALAVDAKGRTYVGDSQSGAIIRINADGTTTFIAGDQSGVVEPTNAARPANQTRFAGADGLAFERSGALFVVGRGLLLRVDAVATAS